MAQTSPAFIQGPNVVVSRAITAADTNTTVAAVELPAKSFVPPYGVSTIVVTALSGGSPALNVGDGTTTDGWVDADDTTEGTPGTYTGSAANAAYSDTGKYYATADTIDVGVSASLSAGLAFIVVRYYDFSDLDLSA